MTAETDEDKKQANLAEARDLVSRYRVDIAELVGQIVGEWIIIDKIPRVCVGDIVDGIVEAYAKALSSPELDGDHNCPGVSFHVNANTETKLIVAKICDRLPVCVVIDTRTEGKYDANKT